MNVAEATGTLKVGLALGSGSARGLSHIGVLQGLLEVGIQPAVVCGTSIGSLVGAAFCSGNLDEFGRWFAAMSTRDVFRYMDIRPITRPTPQARGPPTRRPLRSPVGADRLGSTSR